MPLNPFEEALNDQNCRQYASFFHNLSDPFPVLLMIFLHIVTSCLTGGIRSITPGVGDEPVAPAATPPVGDVEATAIPNTQTPEAQAEGSSSDEPPPYQPPAAETATPATAAPPAPKVKRSSAHLFVVGSGLFMALLTSLVFLGLDIQAVVFCTSFSPISIFPRIIFWGLYSLMCLWASTGVACWMILFRDLFGPAAKKKYPITEGFFVVWVFALPMTPFVVIGMALVHAIESCQRKFCSDALEEDNEDAEQGTELEQGSGSNVEEDGEASGNRDEESVALIPAMK